MIGSTRKSANSESKRPPDNGRRDNGTCGQWSVVSSRRLSRFSRYGGLLAGVLFTGSSARAQDALFSALGLDAALGQHNAGNSPAGGLQPPPPSHLGPLNYTLGASVGVEGNDNINYSPEATESDTILHAGLNLGLVWPATTQSELSFNMGAGYLKYLEFTRNDQFQINPGSALNWRIAFEDASLTFFDQFSDSQAVVTEASVSGVSTLPRIDNAVGLRAEWDPGRWLLALGYSHDLYFSDDASYQYLNRSSEYFFVRAARRLVEDTQLGVEASASVTTYEEAIQSNYTSYSLGPYLTWQLTHFLNVSARGGYTIYAFDANAQGQAAQNLGSYYVSLQLTQQLTDYLSQSLSVARSISPGFNQGDNYTQQLTANYSVNWQATDHLGLRLSLTYEDGTQPLSSVIATPAGPRFFSRTEDYSRVGISPAISYQITSKLAGSLVYSHWERTSNFSYHYQDNDVSLQLNYAF